MLFCVIQSWNFIVIICILSWVNIVNRWTTLALALRKFFFYLCRHEFSVDIMHDKGRLSMIEYHVGGQQTLNIKGSFLRLGSSCEIQTSVMYQTLSCQTVNSPIFKMADMKPTTTLTLQALPPQQPQIRYDCKQCHKMLVIITVISFTKAGPSQPPQRLYIGSI